MSPSVDTLVERYQVWARTLAYKYSTLPRDEAVSESLLGLVIAAQTYDEDRGYFAPYARKIINNRLNALYRQCIQLGDPTDFQTLENPSNQDDYSAGRDTSSRTVRALLFTEHGYDEVEGRNEAKSIIQSLTREERKLARMLVKGRKQRTIADAFGVSQPTAHRMVKALRDKVEDRIKAQLSA